MDVFVITVILPLVAGVILDKILGDPAGLPHPVVGFGRLIGFFEHRWNKGTGRNMDRTHTGCRSLYRIMGIDAFLLFS